MDFERILSSLWLDKFDKFVPFSFYWFKRNTFKKKNLVCSLREVFVRVDNFAFHVSRRFFVKNNFCESIVTFSSSFEFWGENSWTFKENFPAGLPKLCSSCPEEQLQGNKFNENYLIFGNLLDFELIFSFGGSFQKSSHNCILHVHTKASTKKFYRKRFPLFFENLIFLGLGDFFRQVYNLAFYMSGGPFWVK